MDMFSALADPNRRNIVELLSIKGELSVSDISSNFKVTPPAISQHLKVLREAELVKVEKKAQQRIYKVNPHKVMELEEWTQKLKKNYERKLDRLDELLKELHGR